jgi:CRISPR/Cas system CSM-associated protein Csm3 (group 7 of RAMP superfamily)
MNPYDFVRFAGEPDRSPAPGKLRFAGLHGRLDCVLTARSPLFVYQASCARREQLPEGGDHEVVAFQTIRGNPVIPASSLRGALRGVAEAASRSCVFVFDGRYERGATARDLNMLVPTSYRHCQRPEALCPACVLFGTAQQQMWSPAIVRSGMAARPFGPPSAVDSTPPFWSGCVAISDAEGVVDGVVIAEPTTVATTFPPKPHHDVFYLFNGHLAGRKFYFHQPDGPQPAPIRTPENRTISPVLPGSRFRFTVDYNFLSDESLRLLLYSLVLEPDCGHKIGYGKALGLGSAQVTIERVVQRDSEARYSAEKQQGSEEQVLEGDELEAFLSDSLHPIRQSQTFFMQDLRRVLRLAQRDAIGYPSAIWFSANPQTPLRVINAPGQRAGLPALPVPREVQRRFAPPPARTTPPESQPVAARPAAPAQPSPPSAPSHAPIASPPLTPSQQPAPVAAATNVPQDDRPFTLADLVARFNKGGLDETPEPRAPESQQPRKMNRADRAREDQRRLLERLRGRSQDT